MQKLAMYCGLKSVEELYMTELPGTLAGFVKESATWQKSSPRRLAFKILVGNAKEAVLAVSLEEGRSTTTGTPLFRS